jgi:phosphoribosyl-AMP cyclohydrolase
VPVSQSTPPPVALSTGLDPLVAARLKRDAAGLVPAIVQQYDSGAVLMLAWMNDAALARTLASGQATYWSRSRQTLWVKGETSGNRQAVHSVTLDCDGDTLLVRVDQTGPACHTGAPTCFEDVLLADSTGPLGATGLAGAAGPVGAAALGDPIEEAR